MLNQGAAGCLGMIVSGVPLGPMRSLATGGADSETRVRVAAAFGANAASSVGAFHADRTAHRAGISFGVSGDMSHLGNPTVRRELSR
jgi:hypothetical protein